MRHLFKLTFDLSFFVIISNLLVKLISKAKTKFESVFGELLTKLHFLYLKKLFFRPEIGLRKSIKTLPLFNLLAKFKV